MTSRRRHVVHALWAFGLPFLMAGICTLLFIAVVDHTSLMDINPVPEETTPLDLTVVTVAYWAALALSSAAGYVFVWRLFVRHAVAIAVAVVYFPLMSYLLVWFSFLVQIAVNGGP